MGPQIDHHPNLGGHIQIAHGDDCVSLFVHRWTSAMGVVLTPQEALDVAFDLIRQAQAARKEE